MILPVVLLALCAAVVDLFASLAKQKLLSVKTSAAHTTQLVNQCRPFEFRLDHGVTASEALAEGEGLFGQRVGKNGEEILGAWTPQAELFVVEVCFVCPGNLSEINRQTF